MLRLDAHRKYWLALDPHVYTSCKGSSLLAYDCVSGGILWWKNAPRIARLGRQLRSGCPGVLTLSGAQLVRDPQIRAFAATLRDEYVGDIIDCTGSRGEPLQLPTIVPAPAPSRAKNISAVHYLREITVYLNTACAQSCAHCLLAHRQVKSCGLFDGEDSQLSLQAVLRLIAGLPSAPISITFVGGNVLMYPALGELLDMTAASSPALRLTLCVHLSNVLRDVPRVTRIMRRDLSLRVIVPWGFTEQDCMALVSIAEQSGQQVDCVFLIRENQDASRARAIAHRMRTVGVRLAPYYDGRNLSFFERNVFTKLEHLAARPRSLHTIRANAVANMLAFGKLVVRSSGEIYAGVNSIRLGSITDCTLADAADRALQQRSAWLQTRRSVAPCCDCVFDTLCPPLTHYEHALGRNDLCDIWGYASASSPECTRVAGTQAFS